jgi:hypothetical protein
MWNNWHVCETKVLSFIGPSNDGRRHGTGTYLFVLQSVLFFCRCISLLLISRPPFEEMSGCVSVLRCHLESVTPNQEIDWRPKYFKSAAHSRKMMICLWMESLLRRRIVNKSWKHIQKKNDWPGNDLFLGVLRCLLHWLLTPPTK